MADLTQSSAQGLSNGPIQQRANPGQVSSPSNSKGNPAKEIDAKLAQGIKKTQFPADLPKYYMSMYISDYSRQTLTRVGDLKRKEVIRLPLPLNLEDYHVEEWREYEYGMVAGAAAEGIGPDSLTKQLGIGALPIAADIANELLGTNITTGALRPAAGLTGVAPNMFQTILYRGPRFKEPKFLLKLAPRNANESTAIRDIINSLNIAMAPKFNGTFGKLLFDFPDIFEIAYWPNAGWLHKFKPCVLKMMHVNYTGPDHRIAFYGRDESGGNNPPEAVEIELHFQELEYWTKENFEPIPTNNPFTGANKEFKQGGK